MKLIDLLKFGQGRLKIVSTSPDLDSEILASFALKKDRSYILSHPEVSIEHKDELLLKKLISRREKGEPVAYITNSKEFYSLDFFVDKNVLIPRPETEMLVELALEEIKNLLNKKKQIRIADICTGSGCIGISIANSLQPSAASKIEILLSDISEKALQIARKNKNRIIKSAKNIYISFVKSDLFENIQGKFDLIVSNPPYIPTSRINSLDQGIKNFEPREALDGGREGLEVIYHLVYDSRSHLSKGGVLIFEMDDSHSEILPEYFKKSGLKYKFYKDYSGVFRFCKITY